MHKTVSELFKKHIFLDDKSSNDSPVVMVVKTVEEESNSESDKFISTNSVAEYYGVSQETVRDWIEKNIIPAERGRYIILREDWDFIMDDEAEGR